jgi:hypothetical protein
MGRDLEPGHSHQSDPDIPTCLVGMILQVFVDLFAAHRQHLNTLRCPPVGDEFFIIVVGERPLIQQPLP